MTQKVSNVRSRVVNRIDSTVLRPRNLQPQNSRASGIVYILRALRPFNLTSKFIICTLYHSQVT